MAEQLKVIIIIPLITIFITFTYFFTFNQPLYESSSKILLPENQVISGGLAGIASQFGVNLPQDRTADLSSPSLFPELINSRTFAERILDKPFYSKKFNKELSLLAILTFGEGPPNHGPDTLIQKAMITLQGMIKFKNEGSFSILTVEAKDPYFARDLNKVVLDELQSLNRYFKNQSLNEKTIYIDDRIESVNNDLMDSEQALKKFREQNRQISSPALQLELEHLTRDVEIQKSIFLTLKQQQELNKIEVIEKASIVQVLDGPQVALSASNTISTKLILIIASILGLGLGIILGLVRSYANNSDVEERKKLRRAKYFFYKKSKEFLLDRRVHGAILALLLVCFPFFISHRSNDPVYFAMYSKKLLLFNIAYVLILLIELGLFVHTYRNRKINKKNKTLYRWSKL